MPNRLIYESITTSESLNALSDSAERMWHRLTVIADDYGRFDARPEVVRAKCFPLRVDDWPAARVTQTLGEIESASAGDFLLYESEGKPYGCFLNWPVWQRTRAVASKYPPPQADARDGTRTAAGRGSRVDSSNPDSSTLASRLPIPRLSAAEIGSAFDEFWAVYPRKVEKQGARRKFETVVRSGVDPAEIVCGAERFRDDPNRDEQFTKHPTTWLNNGCWTDAPFPPRSTSNGKPKADRLENIRRNLAAIEAREAGA